MNILVTGGLGYIGSHACVALMQAQHQVVILDNLSNSKREKATAIAAVAGKTPIVIQGDIRDEACVERCFVDHPIDGVMHFAGLKAVGESVAEPIRYYDNNVHGSLVLFEAMRRHRVSKLVFSSSATVYGDPSTLPIREDAKLQPTNPYGRSKWMIEQILGDISAAEPSWSIAVLRYFNPVGAHESGMIGEDPSGIPNNLMPYVAQVAAGQRDTLSVFGDDYPTPDGTGVRDYIHVVDLVSGHVEALKYLESHRGLLVCNLGTGQGYSVLEMVSAFERVSGRKIPYKVVARRPGDVAQCYADASLANATLGWSSQRSLDDMCRDAWRFVSQRL